MENKIYFAKVDATKETKIPTKREEDAGYDVYANFDEDYLIIQPHETVMIPTNLASAFSSDYVAVLKERGSTGTKGLGQRSGILDSGYRNEWFVPITNHSDKIFIVLKQQVEYMLNENRGWLGNEVVSYEFKTKTTTLSSEKGFIIYPYEKAICQVLMVKVPKLQTEEISYEELLKFESERGTGKLGSSEK